MTDLPELALEQLGSGSEIEINAAGKIRTGLGLGPFNNVKFGGRTI
jgi:hypothetical protein